MLDYKNKIVLQLQKIKFMETIVRDLKEVTSFECKTCDEEDMILGMHLIPHCYYNYCDLKNLITELCPEQINNFDKDYIELSKPAVSYIAHIINKHCKYVLLFYKLDNGVKTYFKRYSPECQIVNIINNVSRI